MAVKEMAVDRPGWSRPIVLMVSARRGVLGSAPAWANIGVEGAIAGRSVGVQTVEGDRSAPGHSPGTVVFAGRVLCPTRSMTFASRLRHGDAVRSPRPGEAGTHWER